MRDKIITLFNKNHITLQKTVSAREFSSEKYVETVSCSNSYYSHDYKKKWIPKHEEIIEKESPLGFVYYQKKIELAHYEYNYNECYSNDTKFIKYKFYLGKVLYEFSYPASHKNLKIDAETRPWEIMDDYMEDHFVTDLLNEINELIRILKENKVSQYKNSHDGKLYDLNVGDFKVKLYTELFGNKNGPRYQTNDEKIVSHGFDLKTSFRKM